MVGREKNRLTAVGIKSAADGKLADGGGLMLEKAGSAGKWTFRYSFAGGRREMGLGSWPDTSLAEARKARDRWAGILRDGKDPIAERARQRDAERAEIDRRDPTFGEMAEAAFEARKASLRGEGERGRWFSPIRVHLLPKLGARRMTDIHQTDLRDALAPLWRSKPATAEKAIQRTAIIFRHAKLAGIAVDPFTVEAAKHLLGDMRREIVHIEATPWQAIPALYAKLDGRGATRLALRWMILTAVRSDGARGARLEEIDGDVWTVPADRMKGREGKVRDFRVPLSTEAQRLAALAAETARDGYLFPSYRKGCISDTALAKMLNEMGEAGRPHGFRTSFRSWVQDHDAATYDVAEKALGHIVGGKVERSYARSDLLDQRRILMEKWAAFVTGAEAKVIQLRRG